MFYCFQVRLSIAKDDIKTGGNQLISDEQMLQDIIIEMVTAALRSATNHFNWSNYADAPRFVPSVNPAEPILPVHYDSMVYPILFILF